MVVVNSVNMMFSGYYLFIILFNVMNGIEVIRLKVNRCFIVCLYKLCLSVFGWVRLYVRMKMKRGRVKCFVLNRYGSVLLNRYLLM